MKRAIEWFAGNRVAANVLMALVLGAGLITAWHIKLEVFPEFTLDMISVTVEYLGAAPEEVEEGVCIKVEEAVQGIDGVKRIISTASEGMGTVLVELERDADSRRVLDDVKARVDAIKTFPEETEKPVIREVTSRRQVIDVAVWGDADEASLKHLAERVRDEIAAIPGITMVELHNVRPFEISIEVSETALRRYGLTFSFVADAVRRSSLDLPGGSMKTEGGEILLRAKGQAYRGREFEDLVLLTRPDGTRLRLGDVARVKDGFADTDQWTRFDGKPGVLIKVFRTGDQRALDVAEKVKNYVAEAEARLPKGVHLTAWQDMSKVLRDRLELLLRNGRNGFILVFFLLAIFLRLRLAFWVTMGIPVAFLGALWLMPTFDISINLVTLFAFIVVLGIVVDDAIVVGENIFTHQQRLRRGLEGSIKGTLEVYVPVTFAVLTNVAAFVPLLSVPGMMGKIMRVIPLIVIPCFLFSLVECLFILPAHLSHMGRERPRKGPWSRLQGAFQDGLQWFIDRVYRPMLGFCLEWRYLTAALALGTLILTLGTVGGGWIRFVFFPPVEGDFISAALTMPRGTPAERTLEAMKYLEGCAEQVRREFKERTGQDLFRHVSTAVGDQPYLRAQARNPGEMGRELGAGHLGEVTIELVPAEDRTVSSQVLADRWREIAGSIPEAVALNFTAAIMHTGEDINVQFTGPNVSELRAASRELKDRLAEYKGVYEIADSFRRGKREIKLRIKPEAEVLGLTLANLARQVRQAFYGEEAQRIQRGRDEVRVMVRYPEQERRSIWALENLRIRTPAGDEVPFREVAETTYGRGYASITRTDRRRSINVTADVDEAQDTPGRIIGELKDKVLPGILARHPGVFYTFEGSQAQQRDTLQGLKQGFTVAILLIFVLLAVPLRSYLQPLIIMTAIPFGLVGAVWGHLIMGLDLTILSLFGFVALTGVVVNDSLVMVDFINRGRKRGGKLHDVVRQAGVVRFRPIILTSVTTFAGLLPLIVEKSVQARFLVPMAISLAFGVIFSTAISLVLVPAGYIILEDLHRLFAWLYGGRGAVKEKKKEASADSPA